MLFNSIDFLLFFPIVVLITYVLPEKFRCLWLLIASYFFYMCWNVTYALLLLSSTLITYICGLLVERAGTKKQAGIYIALSLIVNFGILFVFKYFNFGLYLIAGALEAINITVQFRTLDVILPVGISFYTFQAIGYTIDVYRGDVKAEKNIIQYALFVSFFPQLVAGPIERSGNLLPQLANMKKFDYDRAREGFLLMLWGFFLKIVVADRIALFVDTVYADPGVYTGMYIVLATVLFAFQIYCDFYGYSTIAIGAAKILGIDLMENFNAPYLATSVADFWRGWHISLTTFFKDYLYIPLGGNRKGKARKFLNKIIVFLLSGLWHGASLSFVLWGGLNGLYQVVGEILMPVRKKIGSALRLKDSNFVLLLIKGIVTFALVDFSWLFFRAGSLSQSVVLIRSMLFGLNQAVLSDESIYAIMDKGNFIAMLVGLCILLVSDIFKKKNIVIRKVILTQRYWLRCVAIVLFVILIFVFGKYGPGYDAKNFIYFQF